MERANHNAETSTIALIESAPQSEHIGLAFVMCLCVVLIVIHSLCAKKILSVAFELSRVWKELQQLGPNIKSEGCWHWTMVFNLYWQKLHPPKDNFRTACLPSTIQDDFSLIKSGYGACRGHSSAVYMFELNGEIHEDNLALLDEVDYARIRGIHSGRSTRILKTRISLRRQLYFYVRKTVHYLTCAPFRLRTTSLCSHFTS